MKSYQVMDCIPEFEWPEYTDLQVMQSAAGYYLGTIHDDGGFKEPGSRDTNYFEKKSTAEKALAILETYKERHAGKEPEFIVACWVQQCYMDLKIDVTYRWMP